MQTLREILDPNFLLRNSVYVSLLIGLACPLVGVFLVVRRMVFLGVALPQISSCGIAFAFALPAIARELGLGFVERLHDSAEERTFAFLGSLVFTLGSILLLAALERRSRRLAEGRVGALYVLAGACSILLLVRNPHGEHGMLDLLRGEIIAVTNRDLGLTAVTFVLVVAALVLLHKEFLLVSFDPDMALTLRKNVALWDGALFVLIGLTVSMSVLSVGPLVSFGFLLLPPLTAYQLARTMRQFVVAASLIGGAAALGGFWIAYRWDLPVGPTDVALLGVILLVAFILRKLGSARGVAGAQA